MRHEPPCDLRIFERQRFAVALRQQDARLFEAFPHRRHEEAPTSGFDSKKAARLGVAAPGTAEADVFGGIVGVDGAAGKEVRPSHPDRLVVAPEHENLHHRAARTASVGDVAHEHDRGGVSRDQRRVHKATVVFGHVRRQRSGAVALREPRTAGDDRRRPVRTTPGRPSANRGCR